MARNFETHGPQKVAQKRSQAFEIIGARKLVRGVTMVDVGVAVQAGRRIAHGERRTPSVSQFFGPDLGTARGR